MPFLLALEHCIKMTGTILSYSLSLCACRCYRLKTTRRDFCFDIRLCLLSPASLPWVCFSSREMRNGREMSRCQQQQGLAQRHRRSHLSVEVFLVAGETGWFQGSENGTELWLQTIIRCHDTFEKYHQNSQRISPFKNHNTTVLVVLSDEFSYSVWLDPWDALFWFKVLLAVNIRWIGLYLAKHIKSWQN